MDDNCNRFQKDILMIWKCGENEKKLKSVCYCMWVPHVYCIFTVHMWTNTKTADAIPWQLMLSSQRASFIIYLAFCISFEGQKRLSVEAKLFLATACMVILKCFHKKKKDFISGLFIGNSLGSKLFHFLSDRSQGSESWLPEESAVLHILNQLLLI